MVNLVIVSHSSRLGEGVGELARQMLMSDSCKIAIAAGIDDPQNPIGTDAVKVMEAIESVADADHVLVMMDMGSALLSAETALELLAPEIAAKVRLCAAPLVEGTLAATVSAASGADIDKVIFDAMHALEAKREQLGLPSSDTEISDVFLRGAAAESGSLFQRLAHISPAPPAKVAAFVQHGGGHFIAQLFCVLRQLCPAPGRQIPDVRFVLRKHPGVCRCLPASLRDPFFLRKRLCRRRRLRRRC